MAFVAALTLGAPSLDVTEAPKPELSFVPVTIDDGPACDASDAPCLRLKLADWVEAANHYKEIADLRKLALDAATSALAVEKERAANWQTTANVAAVRSWYESPVVWGSVGFAVGVAATIAIVAATH